MKNKPIDNISLFEHALIDVHFKTPVLDINSRIIYDDVIIITVTNSKTNFLRERYIHTEYCF